MINYFVRKNKVNSVKNMFIVLILKDSGKFFCFLCSNEHFNVKLNFNVIYYYNP